MVLVDTSVWVDHLRNGRPDLKQALLDGIVLSHPFVIGELALGHLQNRLEILSLFNALPHTQVAEHEEVFHLVHDRHLMGRGLGWVDAHLLASALLTQSSLWTLDRALASSAKDLRLPKLNLPKFL